MNLRVVIRRVLAAAGLLSLGLPAAYAKKAAAAAAAADAKAEAAPEALLWLRELWVPADSLQPILSRYPRVVPLSREQLLTLIHDADAANPAAPDPAHTPPEAAVLRSARFDGRVIVGSEGAAQVWVQGDLEVEVFSDAWAEVPIGLRGIALGTTSLDGGSPGTPPGAAEAAGATPILPALGTASLRRAGKGVEGPVSLLLQGRGSHHLHVEFVLPTVKTADGNAAALPIIEGLGEFVLHLPAGTRADSTAGCAVLPDGTGVQAQVPLRGGDKHDRTQTDWLGWRTPPPALNETARLLQAGLAEVTVNEAGIIVQQEVSLRPMLGSLPDSARFVLPAEARAVQVESSSSAPGWDLGADGLRVHLSPPAADKDRAASFAISYHLPLTLDARGNVAKASVSYLEAVGAHRVQGAVSLAHGTGVQLRRIEPGGAFGPPKGNFPAAADAFVAGFALDDLPSAEGAAASLPTLSLEARRAVARFTVDADASADFLPALVRLRRALTFHVEEGVVFTARAVLPPGETVLALRAVGSPAVPEWRQEGNTLVLDWKGGVAEGSAAGIALDSQADFTAPKAGATATFTLGGATVPAAARLSGYVALTPSPGLRLVTTGGTERLERRDGRTSPVRGEAVWFYRDDFQLAVRAERRAAEAEAFFTGYALPLAGAVEIHAQCNYHFTRGGVEEVKIRVPAELADAVFFTGPGIAERRREGDVWTIRFQGEQTGDYALGIQATVPSPADKDDAQRFRFRLPGIVPLDCVRWSGVWAVEANTDTEIRFTTTGVNETDALHAPALAGYQPQRRVIGVFEFLGGAADTAVNLDGIRHPSAEVAAAIVDRLDLETTVAASGTSRHQATVRARVAGDGFFDLHLPAGSRLWSLLLDGAPVKPVGGRTPGTLRVELPGGRAPSAASVVTLVYETPDRPWRDVGHRELAAPSFDPSVPVLQSHWNLRVPAGFHYELESSPLGSVQTAEPAPRSLLLIRLGVSLKRIAELAFCLPGYLTERGVQSYSGIADPRRENSLPPWLAQASRPVALPEAVVELDLADRLGDPVVASPRRYITATDGSRGIDESVAASPVMATPSPSVAKPRATDQLATQEYKVAPESLPNMFRGVDRGSRDVTSAGSGPVLAHQDAKGFLEASGVTFPPGASATYLPSTNKFVVRNTQDNLDLIAALTRQQSAPRAEAQYAANRNIGGMANVAGLLPMRLELPTDGLSYEFTGGGEPGKLDFTFRDDRYVTRSRWVMLTLGALGFLFFAVRWAHPWRRTFYVALTLTFFPLIAAPSATAWCNALLAGWLWAVAGWVLSRFLLRSRRHGGAAALCLVLLLPNLAHAAPARGPEVVIVPYDETKPPNVQQPASYYLPYDRFLSLWNSAKEHRHPPAPSLPPGGVRYALNSARYDLRPEGEWLLIEGVIDLQTFGEGWVGVPLGFGGAAGAVRLDGAYAALDGKGVLWVPGSGPHQANVTLRLHAGPVKSGSYAAWGVPPTVATLASIILPESGLRAEVRGSSPEIGEMEEIVPEGRRLTASAGGATWLELLFHEAPPPALAAVKPVLARTYARLNVGRQAETVDARIDLAFPGGTQDHFTVLLDRGLTLTGLDASGVERWHLAPGGDQQTLELTLRAPARDHYQLNLTADRPLPPLPVDHRAFPLVSAEAVRTEQTAVLAAQDDVELSLPNRLPTGLRRVADPASNGQASTAFAGETAALLYGVRPYAGKNTARIDYLYQLSRAKIELGATLKLKPGDKSTLPATAEARLPAGFAVQTVAGGDVRQWWQTGDVLALRFRPAAAHEELSLVVYLVQQFERPPDTFTLKPLVLDGFVDIAGEAVVAADRSWQVALNLPAGARSRGLGEIDPAAAAREFEVKTPLERQRAFRYAGENFEASVTLEIQPEKWLAHWVTRASVHEGIVALETRVGIEAQQGAVEAVEFQLPAGVPEARVSGPDVRETLPAAGDKEHRAYCVLLQEPLAPHRERAFTISVDLPLGPGGIAPLPALTFPASSAGPLAGGYLVVENASSGEMSLAPGGLEPAVEKTCLFCRRRSSRGPVSFAPRPVPRGR